jgi:regulator of sigma E protease
VFTLIWWIGFDVASPDNRIILATDYTPNTFPQQPPAAAAGLRTGDRITAIDGVTVQNWQEIRESVSRAPGKPLRVTVKRATNGGGTRTLTITPQLDKNEGAGKIGIYPWVDPVVRSVVPGKAAAIAGLRAGDRIIETDAHPIGNAMDLSQALAARPPKMRVTFERAGSRETTTLVFVYDDQGNPNTGIEFAVGLYRSPQLGLGGAMRKSLDETWVTISLTVKGIGLLFQGVKLREAVAGPLRITQYIGLAATSGFSMGVGAGFVSFFRFLAFLSVVLFLMNLLPIPAMDGGQIILFIVEIGRGKPVNTRLIWRLQIIGFSLLVLLFVFASINDVGHLIGR